MGARVRIRGEWVDHPEAKMIDVKDGHLHVHGQLPDFSSYMPIAIYRPESWHRAEMTGDETRG